MDPEPIPCCAVAGCHSAWPRHHIRHAGELCRLCSSCLLLQYRSMYCCCCFLLLGPEPPAHFDGGDPILAPPAPIATCRHCNDAVAHRYCLQSDDDAFSCPACVAAVMDRGRHFSFPVDAAEPLDMRPCRIMVMAGRISLSLLRKEAAARRATADRLIAEARVEWARAYRALAVALGVDPELPSDNHDALESPLMVEEEAPESSVASAANMGVVVVTPSGNIPAPENSASAENMDVVVTPSGNIPAPESSASAANMDVVVMPPGNIPALESSASAANMAIVVAPPGNPAPETESNASNMVAMAPSSENLQPSEGGSRLVNIDLNASPPQSPPAADAVVVVDDDEVVIVAVVEAPKPSRPPPPPTLKLFPDGKNPADDDDDDDM